MDSILEIIQPNERAIAIFTTHDEWASNLQINNDGNGFTGDWVIRANPKADIIVIYHRTAHTNDIYKASITTIDGPLKAYFKKNRYRINFTNCMHKGTTTSTWSEFARCGANPVRYIKA